MAGLSRRPPFQAGKWPITASRPTCPPASMKSPPPSSTIASQPAKTATSISTGLPSFRPRARPIRPLSRRRNGQKSAGRREQDVLDRCDERIEKLRKSAATVQVVDATGKPVTGAKVRAEQIGSDFLFGCNIYMFDRFQDPRLDAAYKDRFAEMFNYATTGFYWRSYERRRGKPDYEYTDKVVAWCRPRGIQIKGHPLLWGNEAGIPAWSDGLPPPDVQRRRVIDIMDRYRGKIDFWEVVNEPTLQRLPRIDEPYRWARGRSGGLPDRQRLLRVRRRPAVVLRSAPRRRAARRSLRRGGHPGPRAGGNVVPAGSGLGGSRPLRRAGQAVAHHRVHAHIGRRTDRGRISPRRVG